MKVCQKCGTEEKITKHHIFPQCYSKEMKETPIQLYYSNYTIPLCEKCHAEYEAEAHKIKTNIRKHYDNSYIDKDLRTIRSIANNYSNLNVKGKRTARRNLSKLLKINLDKVTKKLIMGLKNIQYHYDKENTNKIIVNTVDMYNFINGWEIHFKNWLTS